MTEKQNVTAAPGCALLEARDVSFRYGSGPWILQNVDLQIGEGERVGPYLEEVTPEHHNPTQLLARCRCSIE